ncbi:Por secretion system C-terminal sorting domain-containing protein [Flavobacteriaceae bacterium MAR_2010_188]|nr:Por secretion system C-terminal sorting domain-containing protein [Flavobacteriaceae bacterium MAR_2010_188]
MYLRYFSGILLLTILSSFTNTATAEGFPSNLKSGDVLSETVMVADTTKTLSIPSTRSNLRISSAADNHSVARMWNEAVLQAIRNDYARPTVHARNLFHTTIAMYDAWALYDAKAKPYLMGNTLHGFTSNMQNFTPQESIEISRKKAISYAAFRLLDYRFKNSPDFADTKAIIDNLMTSLGYDKTFTSTDYASGNAAALGNYIAQTIMSYGNADGARELDGYNNEYYTPVNDPLNPTVSGNPTISNPNRWQPLSLDTYIDQSGNVITGNVVNFLSPEWGNVNVFAMSDDDRTVKTRDGHDYIIYHDPGPPPQLSTTTNNQSSDYYKWNFSLVAAWSSHLDPSDDVLWDISPNSIGNLSLNDLPTNYADYPNFYDYENGGDGSPGYSVNPKTGQPYTPQMVQRGDYARVLAEFWADGPDSETPPGHWFTLLNYCNDSPSLVKRFGGQGPILSDLEWDVKGYLILGGAMHDAAISAWGIKGYYDFIRPVSAIRYMGDQGQSSDPNLPHYSVSGFPLREGYVELVKAGDPLVGSNNMNLNKIKLRSWKGPDYITDPATQDAGVDWILAEDWWPYQRPSFVTPPFAGYISGHSTYSRAAAEVLTLFTGDAFFPGGMGSFEAPKNDFLVFEEGPSENITLQWATYRDASDQCSLSRIWGGIHPPADDIAGRLIGYQIGHEAFDFAVSYFNSTLGVDDKIVESFKVYPNPVVNNEVYVTRSTDSDQFHLIDVQGRTIPIIEKQFDAGRSLSKLSFPKSLNSGMYILRVNNVSKILAIKGR